MVTTSTVTLACDWWSNLITVFSDFSAEVLGVRDLGDSIVVACVFALTVTKAVCPSTQVWWHAAELRDGKVTWVRAFGSEADALEAAGLRE